VPNISLNNCRFSCYGFALLDPVPIFRGAARLTKRTSLAEATRFYDFKGHDQGRALPTGKSDLDFQFSQFAP
jgi:hypothetical protein